MPRDVAKSPSRWNLCLDRLLATEDLSPAEARLMHVLMRRTLGWNRSSDRVGERLLTQLCRFRFRSQLQRARKGLIEKGLIEYEPGLGRGNRSLYVIVLLPPEKGSISPALLEPVKGSAPATGKDARRASTEGVVRKGKIKGETFATEEEQQQPREWREELTPEDLAALERSTFGPELAAALDRREAGTRGGAGDDDITA